MKDIGFGILDWFYPTLILTLAVGVMVIIIELRSWRNQ